MPEAISFVVDLWRLEVTGFWYEKYAKQDIEDITVSSTAAVMITFLYWMSVC